MIITKQNTVEIRQFIARHNALERPIIDLAYTMPYSKDDWVAPLRWAEEHFIGDAAAELDSSEATRRALGIISSAHSCAIRWYISNELDLIAFKLRWG